MDRKETCWAPTWAGALLTASLRLRHERALALHLRLEVCWEANTGMMVRSGLEDRIRPILT